MQERYFEEGTGEGVMITATQGERKGRKLASSYALVGWVWEPSPDKVLPPEEEASLQATLFLFSGFSFV